MGPVEPFCADCGASDESLYYTTINPEGGYDRPRVLVCDACMRSGRWDRWIAEHWPTWPHERRGTLKKFFTLDDIE